MEEWGRRERVMDEAISHTSISASRMAPPEETACEADYNSQNALRPGRPYERSPRRELQLPSCTAPPAAFLLAGCRAGANPLPRRGSGASPISTTTGEQTRWRRPVRRGDRVVLECEAPIAQLPPCPRFLLQVMAGGEEKGGEGGLGELLSPSYGPLQHLSHGIPRNLPQDRPSLRQPQLSLPHQEDKQEEDDKEEEESQHTEVQLSAPQLFGEGCACEGRALSLLIAQCNWGGKKGEWMGAPGSDFSFPQRQERLA